MNRAPVLVVGGGPAGLAAAARLADAGRAVDLVELRPALGGAYHRRPIPGVAPWPIGRAGEARWTRLAAGIERPEIRVRLRTGFLGVDGAGFTLLDDRTTGRVETMRPAAIVIATGAVEMVRPRSGWELPGVTTAGGLQVMMKETGRIPEGRILLAGSGPLLVALAGQMVAAGRPPAAIVETGDPFAHPIAGLGLLAHPGPLLEAAGHMARIFAARVPWRRATTLEAIEPTDAGLAVTLVDRRGARERIVVDRVALHDGIRSNDHGFPEASPTASALPFVAWAGDCREVLGVAAAEIDGARIGEEIAARLAGAPIATTSAIRRLAAARQAQDVLARVFAPARPPTPIERLPRETILCRCEGRTVGDLVDLLEGADAPGGREIKLSGRFSMGACQGRFCAHWVAEAAAGLRPDAPPPTPHDLTGRRWPSRPVSIAALVASNSSPDEPTRPT
ncbi:MAG: FAD-dependent oxidoreductase [Hyphomicrobiales bacterium]|nr:FAD-dependent oxidoreductase [Hyphomicrobiales bacterium]